MIGRRGKLLVLNAPKTHFLCWWCSKRLGPAFTTVERRGLALRVHFDCRAPAAEFIAFDAELRRALQGSLIIEDQADSFVRFRYVPEERHG